jgi:hypothetical protein
MASVSTPTSLMRALAYVRRKEATARLAGTTMASSTAEALARIDSSEEGFVAARVGRLQQVQALLALIDADEQLGVL